MEWGGGAGNIGINSSLLKKEEKKERERDFNVPMMYKPASSLSFPSARLRSDAEDGVEKSRFSCSAQSRPGKLRSEEPRP